MFKTFQQALYELYNDILHLDIKIFVIIISSLFAVLLIQLYKMTRWGEPYSTITKEGFENSSDDEQTAKNEANIKDLEEKLDSLSKDHTKGMELITKLSNSDYEILFPEENEVQRNHIIEKMNKIDSVLCMASKGIVLNKYADILRNATSVLTGNIKSKHYGTKLHKLVKSLQDFDEIEYIDDFTSQYNTIQERKNLKNRFRFVLEELTTSKLEELNYLTDCNDSTTDKVSDTLGGLFT